jgi:hypothetical protein
VIGLKQLQTDLVNIVWFVNLTSLIPVILTVLDSWYHYFSTRQNSKHSICQNLLRYHSNFGTLCVNLSITLMESSTFVTLHYVTDNTFITNYADLNTSINIQYKCNQVRQDSQFTKKKVKHSSLLPSDQEENKSRVLLHLLFYFVCLRRIFILAMHSRFIGCLPREKSIKKLIMY